MPFTGTAMFVVSVLTTVMFRRGDSLVIVDHSGRRTGVTDCGRLCPPPHRSHPVAVALSAGEVLGQVLGDECGPGRGA